MVNTISCIPTATNVTITSIYRCGTGDPSWSLVPHAPDSCELRDSRAGSVKAVFAYVSGQVFRSGCPAATDGLDGFCLAPDNIDSGSMGTASGLNSGACCMSMAARLSAFRSSRPALAPPLRSASGSDGVRAVSAARAARRAALVSAATSSPKPAATPSASATSAKPASSTRRSHDAGPEHGPCGARLLDPA